MTQNANEAKKHAVLSIAVSSPLLLVFIPLCMQYEFWPAADLSTNQRTARIMYNCAAIKDQSYIKTDSYKIELTIQ